MIQKKVIEAIYKKYSNRPASPDELNIPLLFEKLPEEAMIEIDGNDIVIGSIPQSSPFHSIPVIHIHAILEFEEAIVIVLHSSILFLSKENGALSVHLRDIKPSLIDRIRSIID
jgi:hypothetical protein